MRAPTSVRFSETMRGYISFGEGDARRGFRDGRDSGTSIVARLTITIDDLACFLIDPYHTARITGEIECDTLGGQLPIEGGSFNLFVQDADPTRKAMCYRLFFRDSVGHTITLTGVKVVHGDAPTAVWFDTTTLYIRVLRGHVAAGQDMGAELVAGGILRLYPVALLCELMSFRAQGQSRAGRVAAISMFIGFFCTQLAQLYVRGLMKRTRRTASAD
jgi:hypothetical protein